jgi:hypothetical protein
MPKKANENLYEFIVWIWDLLSQIQQIISYLLLNTAKFFYLQINLKI